MNLHDPLFPIFLKLGGRPVVLVGGGTVASQKLQPLRQAGARVTVVAPEISAEIAATDATIVVGQGVGKILDDDTPGGKGKPGKET